MYHRTAIYTEDLPSLLHCSTIIEFLHGYKMAHSAMTCHTRFVHDTQGAWATREGPTLANITFWYNPNSGMTMVDVVTTIERNLGPMRIGRVLVRGQLIPRPQFANYKAADFLRDNEAFNCYLTAHCTIL